VRTMTRYATAALLVAALGVPAGAQVQAPGGVVPPGTSVPLPSPNPLIVAVPVAKPPTGFYKSGQVLVGCHGLYPLETGAYLLRGTAGLPRYGGFSYMAPPASAETAPAAPTLDASPAYSGRSHRLFHHR